MPGETNFSIKFGNPFHLVFLEDWRSLRLGDNLNLFRTILRAPGGLIVPYSLGDDALDKYVAVSEQMTGPS